jgi:hypothetical protein
MEIAESNFRVKHRSVVLSQSCLYQLQSPAPLLATLLRRCLGAAQKIIRAIAEHDWMSRYAVLYRLNGNRWRGTSFEARVVQL